MRAFLRINPLQEAFMVSLSNHEGLARAMVGSASWFDELTMKRPLV